MTDIPIDAETRDRAKRIREVKDQIKELQTEYEEHRIWLITRWKDHLRVNSRGKGTLKLGAVILNLRPGSKTVDRDLLRAELGDRADHYFKQGDPVYVINDSSE